MAQPRIALRPLRTADVERLRVWLPTVAAGAGCARWSRGASLEDAVGSKTVLTTAERETFLSYTKGPRRGSANVELLAVTPARRRLGAGGQAALALERRLGRSAKRIYVQVPSRIGLALYFWLRLGYRPLTQVEQPAELDSAPAVWMVRELG